MHQVRSYATSPTVESDHRIDRMYGHIADQYESGDTTSSGSRYTNHDREKESGMGSGRISLLTGLYGHKLRQQHLQEDINSMFDFMNPLGNSRSSSVWKARHRSSKKLIALKGIELDRAHNTNPIGRFSSLSVSTTGTNSSSSTTAYYADPVEQFQFLSKLDHPNIVKYYECHMYSTFCYISKEYCSGGNLLEVRTFPHAECNAKAYIKQLLSAIYYLHGKSIVHRNLKAQAAPEIVRPRKGSELKKSDMWSIGVITYYLICGYFPFRGKSRKDVLNKIRGSISSQLRYPPGVHLSDTCKDFIEKLLCYNSDTRMSARDALQHDWIGEFVPSPEPSPESSPEAISPMTQGPLAPITQTGPPSPPLSPMDPITPPPMMETTTDSRSRPRTSNPNTPSSPRSSSPVSPSPRSASPRSHESQHRRPGTMILKDDLSAPPRSRQSSPGTRSMLKRPESVMTNSISFALLSSIDGKLIDNLLDEVEEDEQKQAAVGPITLIKARSMSSRSAASSKSNRTQSISSRSNKRSAKRLRQVNESTLDFDVLSINGDMIDSILDEVDENERLLVAHQAMQKGPADLDTLAAASNAADEAIRSMNAMLSGFSFFQKPVTPTPAQ